MPPESPANNTGKDVAARRAGGGFTVRIPCPGVLLDAPKLESSKIWTTRRPYRHPVAGGGMSHLQLSSPPGGFRKMLPKFSATLTMLSHGATTPPLCPSQFATSYRRPNFGHRTGSLRQIAVGKSLPRTRFRVCIGAPGGSICRRPGSLALIFQGGQISPPVGIQAGDRRQLVAARRLYSIADVCSCGTTWQHSFSQARSSHIAAAPEAALFSVFVSGMKLLEYSHKGSQSAGNSPQRGRANIMAAKPCRTAKTKAARRIG